jgi:hypothetical protein
MSISLSDFWPTTDNCRKCLITAAESASDALFLAVHQSMPLSRRLLSSNTGEAEPKTEKDLLEAFLNENLPSGTLILPIVGSSGVGKSHMIRWLDANMRRRQDGVTRHIVRIPRSSSLRRVLELILDTEEADENVKLLLSQPSYQELNETLTSATLPPTLQEATHQLRGKLLIALENAYKDACERLSSGTAMPDDPARRAHCGATKLPALLVDSVVSAHFMAYDGEDLEGYGVLARIASRCIDGQRDVDDGSSFFTIEDLVVDASFDRAEMANPVRQYLTSLDRRDGAGRLDAVNFLNEIIDDAISQLLAFGGFSLTDLFVQIRKCMLKDGIELVLLIEDFAALAGVQGSLLDAIICEGVRGDQELCTMRTALAVTSGYLANRETVLTRADYEWQIADYPFSDEAEAVETYTNFVAGYLNAARWGKDYLEVKYQPGGDLLGEWLPDFYESKRDELSDDDVLTLEAFGRSQSGGMLFPFNSGVIRQLVNRYLRDEESYKFNPRELIKRVLSATLADFRSIYVDGYFPPEGFQNFNWRRLEGSVSEELRSRVSSEQYGRLAAFVYHWGDNPRSIGQAADIDSRILSAFNLTEVNWSAKPEKRDPIAKALNTASASTRGNEPRDLSADERKVEKWKELLTKWREDGVIAQARANEIRNLILQSVWDYIDWNALLLIRPESGKTILNQIRLPKVTTNNPEMNKAIIVALSDEDWDVPERVDKFFQAMTAMCSFSIYKTWNYAGGELDSVNCANYIESLSGQVTSYYSKVYRQLPREGVSPLAQALLVGARLLNLPGSTTNVRSDNVMAICSTSEHLPIHPIEGKWGRLYNEAREHRQMMLDLLTSQAAARQGSGDKLLAIDAALLLRAIDEVKNTWTLGSDMDLSVFKDQPSLLKSHVLSLKKNLKPALDERVEELSAWNERMSDWFLGQYDFSEVKSVCFESIKLSQKATVFTCGDISSDVLKRRFEELEAANVSQVIGLIQDAKETEKFGQRLSAVAKVDQMTVSITDTAFTLYDQFLSETTIAVDERIKSAPLNLNTAAQRSVDEIEEIESLWAELEGLKL